MQRVRLFTARQRQGLLAALLSGLVAATAAFGATPERRFAVKGVGLATCSQFLEAQKEGAAEYQVFGGWIDGYFTALNQTQEGVFDLVSWQTTGTLARSLRAHCRQHPDKSFYLAMIDMARALGPDRMVDESELVEALEGEQKVMLYRATLKRAQKILADLGYPVGAADGGFGPQTARALRDFQEKNGLRTNGLPDQPTLSVLFHQEKGSDGE